MNIRQRLKLKRESMKKWAEIVRRLKEKPFNPKPRILFRFRDCGYCTAYNVDCFHKEGCQQCALNTPGLCLCGRGKDYDTVSRYILYDSKILSQSNALAAAKRMLAAIEADIAEETRI